MPQAGVPLTPDPAPPALDPAARAVEALRERELHLARTDAGQLALDLVVAL